MPTPLYRIFFFASAVWFLGLNIAKAETAIFAGGCFWCVEADFEKLNGVNDVISGFTGGTHPNPTYSGAHTGHYEAVLIRYDPQVINYQRLLAHFWINIDPFDPRGQFCDKGPSYRSAIFVANTQEEKLANTSKAQVSINFDGRKVETEILPATQFFPIKGKESYHQNYARNNPLRYRYYRNGCGRDKRLEALWGKIDRH